MTSDLQQTRYDQVVRRVGGIIGPGAKVSEALSELFPMIDMENLPGELLLLGGTRPAFGGGNVNGVAAESASAQLFNPAGSGLIATLTSVHAGSSSSGRMRWGTSFTSFGLPLSTELSRDTRVTGAPSATCQVHARSAVAQANATGQTRILANTNLYLTDPKGVAILAPGTGFEIGSAQTNSGFSFVFYWHERVALDSELSVNP